MLKHYQSIHEGNPFKCSTCQKTFTFKKVLQNHVKLVHKQAMAQLKYVCDACGKGFDNQNHFQQHSNRHKDQKRFQCASCNYKCYSTSQLNMHMKSCIEGIMYNCSECNQTFMQRQYLKNHFEKQHVTADNHNVYCLKCIKLYKYRNSFVKHMKKNITLKCRCAKIRKREMFLCQMLTNNSFDFFKVSVNINY